MGLEKRLGEDSPSVPAFIKTLESIEKLQARKQPTIRSAQLRPNYNFDPNEGWLPGEEPT